MPMGGRARLRHWPPESVLFYQVLSSVLLLQISLLGIWWLGNYKIKVALLRSFFFDFAPYTFVHIKSRCCCQHSFLIDIRIA